MVSSAGRRVNQVLLLLVWNAEVYVDDGFYNFPH